MARWTGGYLVDVTFPDQTIATATPAWMSVLAVLNGQPPLELDRPLTWVELGCGSGLIGTVAAAACPNVTVWGCDINPAHIERARRLARRAGLDNCTFEEASFAEIAANHDRGPKQADVIVVAGVFSWITAENQQRVVDIIADRLAPGGLVYLTYSATPGAAPTTPLRAAINGQLVDDPRPLLDAMPDAVELFYALLDAGLPALPIETTADPTRTSMAQLLPEYIAHEYFTPVFRSSMFADVADLLAEARCTYVGPAAFGGHILNFNVGPGFADLVAGTGDVRMRETIRDLSIPGGGRHDLFRRGLAPVNPFERQQWLDGLRVVTLDRAAPNGDVAFDLPAGRTTIGSDMFRAVTASLAEGPRSVRDVRQLPVFADKEPDDALATVCLLMRDGYAAPELPGWEAGGGRASCRRLNRALIEDNRRGGNRSVLAAPAVGADVQVEYFQTLVIGAVWDGVGRTVDAITDHILAVLEQQGRSALADGKPVEGEPARQIVSGHVERTLPRIGGVFTELGICEPGEGEGILDRG